MPRRNLTDSLSILKAIARARTGRGITVADAATRLEISEPLAKSCLSLMEDYGDLRWDPRQSTYRAAHDHR